MNLWDGLIRTASTCQEPLTRIKQVKAHVHKPSQQDAILAVVTRWPGITSRQLVAKSTYTLRQVADALERLRRQDKVWSLHSAYGQTGYYLKGVKP